MDWTSPSEQEKIKAERVMLGEVEQRKRRREKILYVSVRLSWIFTGFIIGVIIGYVY